MNKLLNKVLKENKLDKSHTKNVMKIVDEVIKKINTNLKKHKYQAQVMLGGSAAKGTFLKSFDCDTFIRFNLKYAEKDISKMLGKVLKPLKPKLVHGSRDYFQLKYKNVEFEFIPVLKVTNPQQALNVTDCSPLHVSWVKNHLNQKLKNEVLLAKLFCKSIGVYGAESYIKGFSGHTLDILTIYYKSFQNLLKHAVLWGFGTEIDIEKHKTKLNKNKLGPLIIIDPVQPERNAAAALSKEKLNHFQIKAREFLDNPTEEFFKVKKFSLNKIKNKQSKDIILTLLKVTALSGKQDIVGSKLLKAFEFIEKQIKVNNFTLYESGWYWNKKKIAYFWFITKKETLSETFVRQGPSTSMKSRVKSFKAKHKSTFIEKGRIYANVKRPYRNINNLIKDLNKHVYVKERVKNDIILL
ncbi:CCA tRNA nucleotidyltransferase [Nanoarchaeota archaeon]